MCDACEAWNESREPYRVFGNTFHVGVAGLSAVLVASETGHILLDGGLPQSAPLIADNIRVLGYRVEDIRMIVNSHAHFDHAGGIAALRRASGASVASSRGGARALKRGEPVRDDPQYAFGRAKNSFPPVPQVRVVADGEMLHVGDLAITAHFTPGHTPGSTTWTWRSCEESRCLDIMYADSLTAVSAPAFKFTERKGYVEEFRRSIATVGSLPCDILVTVHPGDPGMTCRDYADTAARSLDRRIAEEQ